MQDYEQQSGDKISDAIKVGSCAPPFARCLFLREHSRVYDTYTLMAAETRTVAMARTTWSGPAPMDLSILAKDAVCHVCAKKGHLAKDCWYHTNKGSGKGKKYNKGKKSQGKGTKPKDGKTKKKSARHNCNEVGHFARDCPKKESNNASSSGGGDVHCLTYTNDQSHWIMMLARDGRIWEQSNNIKFLVDSVATCHAWPCKAKPASLPRREIFDCHRSARRISGYAGSEIHPVLRWLSQCINSASTISAYSPSRVVYS